MLHHSGLGAPTAHHCSIRNQSVQCTLHLHPQRQFLHCHTFQTCTLYHKALTSLSKCRKHCLHIYKQFYEQFPKHVHQFQSSTALVLVCTDWAAMHSADPTATHCLSLMLEHLQHICLPLLLIYLEFLLFLQLAIYFRKPRVEQNLKHKRCCCSRLTTNSTGHTKHHRYKIYFVQPLAQNFYITQSLP